MENLPSQECVVTKKAMSKDVCQSLSFDKLSGFTLQSGNSTLIKPTPGHIKKFSLDTFKEVQLASNAFQETKSLGQCGCDNFVMETHYRV